MHGPGMFTFCGTIHARRWPRIAHLSKFWPFYNHPDLSGFSPEFTSIWFLGMMEESFRLLLGKNFCDTAPHTVYLAYVWHTGFRRWLCVCFFWSLTWNSLRFKTGIWTTASNNPTNISLAPKLPWALVQKSTGQPGHPDQIIQTNSPL